MTEQQTETQEKTKETKSPRASSRQGASWGARLVLLVLVLILLLIPLAALSLKYVEPNQYGIKIKRIGYPRGVQEKVYSPGFHIVLPWMEEMHTLPRDIQVLELTNNPETASRGVRQQDAARIQTSDGFFVDVDVSILYRIKDPYKVFTIIGRGNAFEDNGIIPQTEPRLKDAMGDMTTEEFYNSPLRVKKTKVAKDLLNEVLLPKGIEVEQVLVRYFKYSDEIQRNIEEKKLKDQLVFKNQAEARAAVEEAKVKKTVQEGKANVGVELEQGKAYVTQRNAEMQLYSRKKKAEADLLVRLAEAEKLRLKNEALTGTGAERMVGLKMADAYKGLEVIILPSDGPAGVNPLDLDNTLKLFDVRKGGAQ